jgi:hypothetical protein
MRSQQRGSIAVELAIALPMFLGGVYLVVETSHALYVLNTLSEVSRRAIRAAVVSNYADLTALQAVRARAVFNTPNGEVLFAAPFTADNIQISYLAADGVSVVNPLPACPEANHSTCLADPNGAGCIRFVRVRICQPGEVNTCTPVQYQPLLNVDGGVLNWPLPKFESVAPVESLGLAPGLSTHCP